MIGLAAVACHTALYGDHDAVRQEVAAGTWRPELFGVYEPIARAILDIVTAGDEPDVVAVYEALVTKGYDHRQAIEMIAMDGAFEAAGFRTDGLAHWLRLLAEDRERERLRRELVRLGFALETRGGPARVRARLAELVAV